MSAYNDAALKVATKMGVVKEGQAFDPTIIMVIAPIIVELIAALQMACAKTPEDGLTVMRRPNLWQRWKVRSEVRSRMSFREWRKHGPKMVGAILDTAKRATLTEVQALYGDDGEADYSDYIR